MLSAGHTVLAQRAAILAQTRAFFAARHVMEVDVPVLSPAGVTDPNIECLQVFSPVDPAYSAYLMPSPEFYLKRLLVAGCGSVYYLGHAFRAGERGRRHQPEFTMLEWYRPGWDLGQLMNEVRDLVCQFISLPVRQTSYREAFITQTGLDPFVASLAELKTLAASLSPAFDSDERSIWLDLLFSHLVEPGLEGLVFVDGFPAEQAALAQTTVDAEGRAIACRFELYANGVELANAYLEETRADNLVSRFASDLAIRSGRKQVLPPVDQAFLEAMRAGMPDCSGVALGFDRLVMLALGKTSLGDVLPFTQ